MTLDSLLGRLSALILFSAVSIVAGFWVLWLADRSDPARLIGRELLTPTVSPGGQIIMSMDVNRLRYCSVSVQRFLVDGARVRHVLPILFREVSGKLGREHFNTVVNIPPSAAPGDAVYQSIATYVCNPVQNYWPIVVPSPDLHFRIEAQ